MVKRAVVVGINDYSVQGAGNLFWCVRDAQSFYHMLINAFGFDPQQTFCYLDRAASRANILRGLRYIISAGEPGDVACFFFAGHGARVPATATHGDADRWYETIVPASGDFISDYEILQIADTLQPSHVNFTVVLDSCHSGGMHETDAAQKIRSLPFSDTLIRKMVDAMTTLIPIGVALGDLGDLVNNIANVRPGANGGVDLDEHPNRTLVQSSKSTLISACKFSEVAREDSTIGHGLFSQAFIDTVDRTNFQIDHRTLLDRLTERVDHYIRARFGGSVSQTPQLRGQMNRMEEIVFTGFTDSR